MPRIQASTVAEHREQQLGRILAAARSLLAQEGRAPTLAEVAAEAGLARSSIYQYFSSSEDLLAAVVADIFPSWAQQVIDAVEAAPTPGAQIWAYVEANVRLFASSEQAVARALTTVVEPTVLVGPMTEFHESLQQPLIASLRAHGESDPELVADLIGAMVVRASRDVWSANPQTARRRVAKALALLLRLVGSYLEVDDTTKRPGMPSGRVSRPPRQ